MDKIYDVTGISRKIDDIFVNVYKQCQKRGTLLTNFVNRFNVSVWFIFEWEYCVVFELAYVRVFFFLQNLLKIIIWKAQGVPQ